MPSRRACLGRVDKPPAVDSIAASGNPGLVQREEAVVIAVLELLDPAFFPLEVQAPNASAAHPLVEIARQTSAVAQCTSSCGSDRTGGRSPQETQTSVGGLKGN